MSYGANYNRGTKWANRFPVYQIDFTAVASGKRVATSKRRIRWRFGFSNQSALDAGESGTACRGEEHDVTVVWSVTSGKRLILADGQEVHYSTNRSGIFEFSWTMRGNHVIKVICHAAPSVTGNNTRQYDLSVDGESFFVMPKVYELGIRGPISSHSQYPGTIPDRNQRGYREQYNQDSNYSREQEEEDLKRAIQNSIEESRQHLKNATEHTSAAARMKIPPANGNSANHTRPPVPKELDLLDMGGMTITTKPTHPHYANYAPPKTTANHAQQLPQYSNQAPAPNAAPAYVPQVQQSTQSYGGSQPVNHQQLQVTNSAPPPSFSDVYYSTQQPSSHYQSSLSNNIGGQNVPNNNPALTTSVVPSAVVAAPRYSMDHQISDISIDPQSFRSASVPGPRINNNMTIPKGPQPSLAEMQAVKPKALPAPTKEVMNNNSLVVHNNQTGYAQQALGSYTGGAQLQPSYGQNQTQQYAGQQMQVQNQYGNQQHQLVQSTNQQHQLVQSTNQQHQLVQSTNQQQMQMHQQQYSQYGGYPQQGQMHQQRQLPPSR